MKVDLQGRAVEAVQHSAVGHQCDGLVGVGVGQACGGVDAASVEAPNRFAAFGAEVRVAFAPTRCLLWQLFFNLFELAALKNAEVTFPK